MKVREWGPLGTRRTLARHAALEDEAARPAAHGHSFFHLPPIDLRRWLDWLADHHVIPKHWLVAKVMLIAGGGLAMIAIAYLFLGDDVEVANHAMIAHLAGADAAPRADRLPLPVIADARTLQDPIKSSIEQVDDRGIGTRRFIHVITPLMRAPDQVADRHKKAPPGEHMASSKPRVLPSEIMFGSSQPQPLPERARAYASASDGDDVWQPSAVAVGVPINLTVVAKTGHHDTGSRRLIVARHGDTLAGILGVIGVSDEDASRLSALLTPHGWFSASGFAGGEKIAVEFGPDRSSLRPLRVSVYRSGGHAMAAALAHDGHYVLAEAPPPALQTSAVVLSDTMVPAHSSPLRDSLYAVAHAANIAHDAVSDVLAACAHNLDLDAPTSADDKAELLYSSDEQGKPVVVYAAIHSDGKTDRYYRFLAPNSASPEYYDAKGHTVPKPYLRKPVVAGRLGDGFGWRIHPVLHDRRFHEGVDYAAPLGSPIMSAADGVVEKIGREWGYGKYIRIRHDSRFETTYAHIAGIAGGLQVGDRVRQGQTIAYVGSTGLSTGPHLYYEMRVDGRDVDPLHTAAYTGRALAGEALADFEKIRTRVDNLLVASMPSSDKR